MCWHSHSPKRAMTLSSFLSRSSSRASSIDDDSVTSDETPPCISTIYNKAEAYDKVLISTERHDSDPDSLDEPVRSGYQGLVGKDLTPSECAEVRQATKLTVAGDTWTPGNLTEEPETYESDTDASSQETAAEVQEAPNLMSSPVPAFHRPATMEGDAWKLEPTEITRLLISEFGPLAEEGEKAEKLILEADGVMFNGVILLGVLHLTTHRLTFHASLLSSDQSPAEANQTVIKSGSITIHRKGWRSKQRVWLELYPDMIVTCASSSEKDRVRPLRTVLLSNVTEILPHDDGNPCALNIIFSQITNHKYHYAELDTPEAAQDWRREIIGAIFLYRHRRREILDGSAAEADLDSGIRLSCPLDRVSKFVSRKENAEQNITFSTFHVNTPPSDDQEPEEHVFHLSPLSQLHVPAWDKMQDYIDAAKARHSRPSTPTSSPVVVDFGPLNISEDPIADPVYADKKEKGLRLALGLSEETDLWTMRARLFRSVSCSGVFVISSRYVAYWSKSFPGGQVKYRLPLSKIRCAKTFHTFPIKFHGLTLELTGQPDLKFQFKTTEGRDEAMTRINTTITSRSDKLLRSPTRSKQPSMVEVFSPHARTVAVAKASELPFEIRATLPKVINVDREIVNARPKLHFVCLTIGSRGDVQPYIALGLGLMKEHHRVTIVTHEEYKEWVEGFGIGHRTAGGDPGALMKLSVENKMFSPEFFKESLQNFRPWLDQLLLDSWEACQGADVLLESPSAMAGVHIAEALNIPYFRTFTMPWTKTAEFPHAFLSPPVEYSTFNSASYVLFSNVMWTATSGQINRWRRHTLKIGNTDMGHLAQSKIPFIYNFSPAVVPKPLDWSDSICVSGYWFLDNPDLNWSPPETLVEWMDKARADNKPIVYIGFGSITVPHPNRVTSRIIKAVLKSDVRAIISKGWSARMSGNDDGPAPEYPPECYALEKIPHDWLFPRIDVALHHGGAGTTGASLRAGIPTLIKPWFGDQFFWASRVQKLGAGLRVPSLHVHDLADALIKATTSRVMKEKASDVGEKIRSEDGVRTAIHNIYTYLPRAGQDRRTLHKERTSTMSTSFIDA
ncbi:glycosyltransferase family 1 protein [Hymenopellis radicata]|nr:glycosyltransferase family 1 protein [Hymenopellis radicata]